MSALRACLLLAVLGCGQMSSSDAGADASADATVDGAPADAGLGMCCNVKTGPCDAMIDSPYVGACAPGEVCQLGNTTGGYLCCLPNDANNTCQ